MSNKIVTLLALTILAFGVNGSNSAMSNTTGVIEILDANFFPLLAAN